MPVISAIGRERQRQGDLRKHKVSLIYKVNTDQIELHREGISKQKESYSEVLGTQLSINDLSQGGTSLSILFLFSPMPS